MELTLLCTHLRFALRFIWGLFHFFHTSFGPFLLTTVSCFAAEWTLTYSSAPSWWTLKLPECEVLGVELKPWGAHQEKHGWFDCKRKRSFWGLMLGQSSIFAVRVGRGPVSCFLSSAVHGSAQTILFPWTCLEVVAVLWPWGLYTHTWAEESEETGWSEKQRDHFSQCETLSRFELHRL